MKDDGNDSWKSCVYNPKEFRGGRSRPAGRNHLSGKWLKENWIYHTELPTKKGVNPWLVWILVGLIAYLIVK